VVVVVAAISICFGLSMQSQMGCFTICIAAVFLEHHEQVLYP
jgi:hypothetical protein